MEDLWFRFLAWACSRVPRNPGWQFVVTAGFWLSGDGWCWQPRRDA